MAPATLIFSKHVRRALTKRSAEQICRDVRHILDFATWPKEYRGVVGYRRHGLIGYEIVIEAWRLDP